MKGCLTEVSNITVKNSANGISQDRYFAKHFCRKIKIIYNLFTQKRVHQRHQEVPPEPLGLRRGKRGPLNVGTGPQQVRKSP